MGMLSPPNIGQQTASRTLAGVLALCLLLTVGGCNDSEQHKVKGLKMQVQDSYGAKKFGKGLQLAQEGLKLSLDVNGPKAPDTLYFAQAITENQLGLHNVEGAMRALKQEVDMRAAAGQKESKLQRRRTLLIQMAEENHDPATAIAQTVIIAKSIGMGPGKDPQPTYRSATVYPPKLYHDGVEGDVDLGFGLTAEGSPINVRVLHATPPDVFNTAAMESLKTWRFTPMIRDGQPVASTGHHFTLAFRLGKSK
jgi:TonB family protein